MNAAYVGTVTYDFSGETIEYDSEERYLTAIKEAFDVYGINGWKYHTESDDPRLKRMVTEIVRNEYGLEPVSEKRQNEILNQWEGEKDTRWWKDLTPRELDWLLEWESESLLDEVKQKWTIFTSKVDGYCSGNLTLALNELEKEANALKIQCYMATEDQPFRVIIEHEMYDESPNMATYTTEYPDKIKEGEVFLVGEGTDLISKEVLAEDYPVIGEIKGHSIKLDNGWKKSSVEIDLAAYLDILMRKNIVKIENTVLFPEDLYHAYAFDKAYSLFKANEEEIVSFFNKKAVEFYSESELFRVMSEAPVKYPDFPQIIKDISARLQSKDNVDYCISRIINGDFRTAKELRESNAEKLVQLQRIRQSITSMRKMDKSFEAGTVSYPELKDKAFAQWKKLAFFEVSAQEFVMGYKEAKPFEFAAVVDGDKVSIACAESNRAQIQNIFLGEDRVHKAEQGVQVEPRKGR